MSANWMNSIACELKQTPKTIKFRSCKLSWRFSPTRHLAASLLTPRCQQSPAIIGIRGSVARCRHVEAQRRKGPVMNFVSMRLITDDVKRLVGFYERTVGLTLVATDKGATMNEN